MPGQGLRRRGGGVKVGRDGQLYWGGWSQTGGAGSCSGAACARWRPENRELELRSSSQSLLGRKDVVLVPAARAAAPGSPAAALP